MAGLSSDREYLSTPELSYGIRCLKAVGGVNVSASHNHPDDNGFKFFNEQGAQDVAPTDQILESYMSDVQDVKRVAFHEAVEGRLVHPLPAELHSAYININLALRSKVRLPLTVVYTPLCGTGDSTVGEVLRAAGYSVQTYEPHATYDGTFATIPLRLPNPEVPEAASPALSLARDVGADLVICTDPDADRLGVFARDSADDWRYMNGNEIICILAYYLTTDRDLGPRRSGILLKTLVTSRMVQKIAERSGCSIVPDLLVGFKHIAHALSCLEREGRYNGVQGSPNDLVLAGEESHGILLTPSIRDKDPAGGALVLCELVSQLRTQGKHLPEYLDTLSLQCGNHQNVARSIVMRGIEGATLLSNMMRSLRENPPVQFDDLPVLRRRDFLSSEHGPLRSKTERLSRNLLLFELEQAHIVIRPSGTEPKAKIYVDVEGCALPGVHDRSGVVSFGRRLANRVFEECIGRNGFRLSASASLLPDYVDLHLKSDFDVGFRASLLAAAISLNDSSEAEQLKWLRERLEPFGAGADPLGPAGPATTSLLEELCRETNSPTMQLALRRLEQTVAKTRIRVSWVT